MSKLRKLKDIETFKPRLETIYQERKTEREKAIETANNCDPKLKEVKRYDLKR